MNKIQPSRKNGLFYNESSHVRRSHLLRAIPWYIQAHLAHMHFDEDTFVRQWTHLRTTNLEPTVKTRIWWLGHATFLIQINGVNLLMDPIFGAPSAIFKRHLPIAIDSALLPRIDAVLISHNHRDHLDVPSLRTIAARWPQAQALVPWGDEQLARSCGFSQVQAHTWWQHQRIGPLICTFAPAHHWSGRGILDYNRCLWGSWLVKGARHTIYFAGDTAYWHHFCNIAEHLAPVDVALLPIGPCQPSQAMRQVHLDPQDAVRAFNDLRAQHLVPMHWGTFPFGTETCDQPIRQLREHWRPHSPHARLHLLASGQYLEL